MRRDRHGTRLFLALKEHEHRTDGGKRLAETASGRAKQRLAETASGKGRAGVRGLAVLPARAGPERWKGCLWLYSSYTKVILRFA